MSIVSLTGRTLRLAVPLYLSTLLLAILPVSVAMLGLFPLAGDRPWRGDLLSPGWMNVALEMVMNAQHSPDVSGLILLVVAALLVGPFVLLCQVVVYSFLAGGVLATLAADPASQPPFWATCRRWFWPSFRLSLLGGVLVIAAAILGAGVTSLTRGVIGPELTMLIQFALQAVVLGWLECARALMVLDGVRSVGVALRRGSRAVIRPVVLVVWLLIALPGAGLVLAAMMPPGVDDPYAPSDFLLALLFGQVVAFIGAWSKVVRLAVALRVAAAVRPGTSQTSGGLSPALSQRGSSLGG